MAATKMHFVKIMADTASELEILKHFGCFFGVLIPKRLKVQATFTLDIDHEAVIG
jgi:hypothetical protein